MGSELRPCPFCGGRAELVAKSSEMVAVYVHVACSSCGARHRDQYGVGWISQRPALKESLDPNEAETAAIAAWNRRAPTTGEGGAA